MRRHGLLVTLILIPLLVVGADSLVWLLACRQVQTVFQHWIAARRAEGWQVTAGTERLAGWPFAALVRIGGFTISGGDSMLPGGLSWHSERLALRLSLASPGHLELLPAGLQTLRLFGSPAIVAAAHHISAVVRFAALPFIAGPTPDKGLLITATEVHIRQARSRADLITAQSVALHAMPARPPAGDAPSGPSLKFDATEIAIPHEEVPALGPTIGILSFSGALIHQVPAGTNWTSRLAAWRDHGGMVALRGFSLVWGPLAIGASGRLTLDPNLQPSGQATARIVGYAATLDALASAGRIGSGVATAAKALLTLLARPSSASGPPEVDVPLSLEGRTLRLGQIPLLELPAMSWPSGS
ncbi:MAG: DUF2125 domain-containing protein [Acetobacteraceae bacterium]